MSYTALVLNPESKAKLLAFFHAQIPLDWERVCHHMTINLGNIQDGPAYNLEGQTFELVATTVARDDRVVAVGVESQVPSKNNIKHVTIAVNKLKGKPKHSNELTNWEPLPEPIILQGTVKVVS
jgi:hypothetical protein